MCSAILPCVMAKGEYTEKNRKIIKTPNGFTRSSYRLKSRTVSVASAFVLDDMNEEIFGNVLYYLPFHLERRESHSLFIPFFIENKVFYSLL